MGMARGEMGGPAVFWHEEGGPQVCFLAARGEMGEGSSTDRSGDAVISLL